MTIPNTIIIPALPDTWQICASSSNHKNLGEAIKSQVIAWAITLAKGDEKEHGKYRIEAITAFDANFHHIIESDEQRTYSCNGKDMAPDPMSLYEDELNELS